MTTTSTLVALCIVSATATAQTWLTAPREVVPQIGDNIRAFADFNGDGRLDLVVTRARTNIAGIAQLRIDLATVGGDYVTGTVLPVYPQGYQGDDYVLAGDVTGDGLPDIVTSLRELSGTPGSGILLYQNLGGGTFSAPQHTRTGVPWANGVLSDWNGDGVSEVLAIHLGTGTGTLQRWSWQNGGFVGSNARPTVGYVDHIAVGEVTGDGLPDVVCGSSDWNLIWVVPTLPGGGLGPMVGYTVGAPSSPWGRVPVCGDIDGDGDDDIVVGWPTGTFSSAIAILTHDGAGTLTVGATQALDVQAGGYWNGRPHVVDWDGDGDGDVVICWEYFYVLENQGAANLRVASAMRVGQSSSNGSYLDGNDGVGAADFDRDGRIDFATGRQLVHGTGRFEDASFGAIASSIQQPVDWDGDGDIDILESGAVLRQNQGRSGFGKQMLFPAAPPGFFYTEAYGCGDFNGDGHLDLIATYHQQQFLTAVFIGMRLLAGGADGRLRDVGPAGAAGVRIANSFSFTVVQRDLDGDGDADIATDDGWWENNGSGLFTMFRAAWTGRPIVLVDADGNGHVDVLTVTYSTPATTWRLERNQGGASFVSELLATGPGGTNNAHATLVDLDGDGDRDFAVGIATGPVVLLRENQGGTFAAPQTLGTRDRAFETLLVDDFDGDGLGDIAALSASIAGHFGDTALVWRRTGPGLSYAAPRAYFTSEPVFAQADLDGDGDPDAYGRYSFVASGRHAGPSAGSYDQYGQSQAGASGIEPVLGLSGPARAGTRIELRLRHGEGGGAAVLVLGLGATELANTPLPGLTLRVAPISVLLPLTLQGPIGVPGAGFLHLPVQVPLVLRGFSVFNQAFFVDGTGFAASNGLEIAFGG